MNIMIKVIQDRRLQMGYNFHDIEQAIGIPAKRMHSFEKGTTHLSLDETERLFKLLNLNHVDMFITKRRKKKRRPLMFTMLSTAVLISLALFFIFSTMNGETELANANQSEVQQEGEATGTIANDEEAVEPITEPTLEGIRLRFWGNMPYQSDRFPQIHEQGEIPPTYEIVPVEQLRHEDQLPNWLAAKDKDHLLLNLGTRFIWETLSDVEKERDRLNKNGYKNVGIDYLAEVYKPYILATEEGNIGFLALSNTILDAEHLAERNEVGIARGNNRSLLLNAIADAKKDVEMLVVLIGWGDREAMTHDPKNAELAQEMIAAGADLIVGNHSIYGQEIEWVDGVPVFYSLGHTISEQATLLNLYENPEHEVYSYVLDALLIDQKITDMKIHIGRFVDGVLMFDLTKDEKASVKQKVLPQVQQAIKIHD